MHILQKAPSTFETQLRYLIVVHKKGSSGSFALNDIK